MMQIWLEKVACALLVITALISQSVVAGSQGAKPLFIWGATEWMEVQRDKRVKVVISDQVSDGCWRDAQTSKTAVELEFIRSGFKLDDKARAAVGLTAVGYKTKGLDLCAVSYSLTVTVMDIQQTFAEGRELVAMTTDKNIFYRSGVMTGQAHSNSDRLKGIFVDLSQSALVYYSKQIQDITDALKKEEDKEAAAFWLNWMNTPKSD